MPAAAEPSTDGSRFVVSNWAGREPLRPACVTRRYVILEAPNPLREDKGFDDLKHAYYSTRHNPSVERNGDSFFAPTYTFRDAACMTGTPQPLTGRCTFPVRRLEAADQFGKQRLRQPQHDVGKKIANAIVAKKIT